MSYLMEAYDSALEEILKKGIKKSDRTGVGCISVAGLQRSYDLSQGDYDASGNYTCVFPIVTGRKVFPKSVFAELLWFLSGSTKNQDLIDLGAKFWSPWCDEENPKYRALRKEFGYKPGDFGPIYGWQLRHFGVNYTQYRLFTSLRDLYRAGVITGGKWMPSHNEIKSYPRPYREAFEVACVVLDISEDNPTSWDQSYFDQKSKECEEHIKRMLAQGFDQLAYMVDTLKNDPFGSNGRRCLFSLWNPNDLKKMALPPCFLAGTLVNTAEGPKSIEDIQVGEDVLTSYGRYKGVYKSMKTPYSGEIVEIKARYGLSVSVTPNHPIQIKDKGFVDAGKVSAGDYIGIPRNQESIVPYLEDCYANQWGTFPRTREMSANDFYMMGYFAGDGWTMDADSRCCFAISDVDKEVVLPKLREVIGICEKPDSGVNVKTYETKNKTWHRVLRQFGYKAGNKTVPMWILNAPNWLLRSFMDGYMAADGGLSAEGIWGATTTSKKLAQGIQAIGAKLGEIWSISHQKRSPTCVIEGRIVNQSDTYCINLREGESVVVCDDMIWVKVTKQPLRSYFSGSVYNISVEEDHTYTANNIANHNCHYTYQAIPDGDGGLTGILTQRSNDVMVGNPANIQFYSALTIMLAQQANMKPRAFVHNMNDAHIYLDQIPMVEEYLSRDKPDSPTLKVEKSDDIESYSVGSFVLENYNPLEKIDVPVAV